MTDPRVTFVEHPPREIIRVVKGEERVETAPAEAEPKADGDRARASA